VVIRVSITEEGEFVDRRDDAITVPAILRPTVDDGWGGIVIASPGGHTAPRGGSQGARKRGRQRPTSRDRRDPTIPVGTPTDNEPERAGPVVPPLGPEVAIKTPPFIPIPGTGSFEFSLEGLVNEILNRSKSVTVGVPDVIPIPQVCRPLCQPICQ